MTDVNDPRLQSVTRTRQQRRAEQRRQRKEKRRGVPDFAAGAALAIGAAALASPAGAATILVNSNADTVLVDGQCTLREALANANDPLGADQTGGDCTPGTTGADTIDLSGRTGSILLGSTLRVLDSLTISGPGAATLAIDGQDTNSIFYMYSPALTPIDVTLSGLTLQNGHARYAGGAIQAGSFGRPVRLTLSGDVLQNNVVRGSGGAIAFASYNGTDPTTAGSLTISNTTITGNASVVASGPGGAGGGPGGGIVVKYAGAGTAITLDTVTLTNNQAKTDGGGLDALLGCGASLTIKNSTITGNEAGFGAAAGYVGGGGGVYVRQSTLSPAGAPNLAVRESARSGNSNSSLSGRERRAARMAARAGAAAAATGALPLKPRANAPTTCATVSIQDTSISNNTSDLYGGGLYADLAAVTIQRSVLSGNQTTNGGGGGIFVGYGSLDIQDSTIGAPDPASPTVGGNTALYGGGGVYANYADVSMLRTVVSGNTAGGDGGGLYFSGGALTIHYSTIRDNSASNGGGVYANNASVDMQRTTLTGNTVQNDGGAISLYASSGSITNSTIANNTATLYAGGIYLYNTSLDITNTTVSGNIGSETGEGAGIYARGYYGGSYTVNITNSIISNNNAGTPGTGSNLHVGGPVQMVVTFTDIFPADATPTYTDDPSNIHSDPVLAPLADNGGPAQGAPGITQPTLTMLQAPGSPVIDAGNTAAAAGPNDERGAARVQGTAVDMGAVETSAVVVGGTITAAPSPASGVEGTVVIITLTRANANGAATVNYSTAGGTATSGADFVAVTNGIVTFADGETTKTISIQLNSDIQAESTETFTLNLSTSTPGFTVSPGAITVSIVDVPPIPTLGFWMKLVLLLSCAGVGVVMIGRGRLLVYVLAAGLALSAAPRLRAGTRSPVQQAHAARAAKVMESMRARSNAKAARSAARKPRRAAVILDGVSRTGGRLSLKSGTVTLDVPEGRVKVVDRRVLPAKHVKETSLQAGMAVLYRVHGTRDGSVNRVRITIYNSLTDAQAALKRHRP